MKSSQMRRVFALLLLSLFLTVLGSSPAFPQTPTPSPAELSDAQKRKESFEIVWKTVNERFYDPTFGGVDWKKWIC